MHRPSGPFLSLSGGMDRKLKIYFDRYRTEGKLPPELEGKLFEDLKLLDVWRNNRKGLSWQDDDGALKKTTANGRDLGYCYGLDASGSCIK